MEIALMVLVVAAIVFVVMAMFMMVAIFMGEHNITVVAKQEFSAEDRQLLEDLYNEQGDLKSKDADIRDALDQAVKNINEIMLDMEDTTNE